MTPDQIHEAHRRLKQLDKLHETKTHINRSRLTGVWVEFSDETRKLLPISETTLKEFIDQQITRLEDALRGQGSSDMKLFIDEPLTWAGTYYPSITEEDREEQEAYVKEISKLLDKFCVCHWDYIMESGFFVTLSVQKCTLTEQDMNELFHEILLPHFGVGWLKYSPLGGAGCDFAVRIDRNSLI